MGKTRRVNRKRKALITAKGLAKTPIVWNVCQDTQKDLWQVIVVEQSDKSRIATGPLTEGRNKSYAAFTESCADES